MSKDPEISKAVGRGMAIAAGIVAASGQYTVAKDILTNGCLETRKKLLECDVDDYDLKLCLDALKRG